MGETGADEADGEDLTDGSSWARFVGQVVADVRASFGTPVAREVAALLSTRRTDAESALGVDGSADTDGPADRREAEELVRDAVNNWRLARAQAEAYAAEARADAEREADGIRRAAERRRADAEAELARLHAEIADLRTQLDDLHAPLDAREAELIAWEAELTEHADLLGGVRADGPPVAGGSVGTTSRREWRSAGGAGDPYAGRRGWGRRHRADDADGWPAR